MLEGILLGIFAIFLTLVGALFRSGHSKPFSEVKEAAERGDASSQNILGGMYREGNSAPKNDAEAVKWWRKAAEQRHPEAQAMLGLMHIIGRGTVKNEAVGYKWLLLASAQGYESELIEKIAAKKLTEEQRVRGRALAKEFNAKRGEKQNFRDDPPKSSTTDTRRIKALATLGVDDPASSAQDIKEAYRRMCKIHHPDRFAMLGEKVVRDANDMLCRLREAYDYLQGK